MQVIKDKKIAYGLYDFANSAYILIFNAYAFPIFYKEVVWRDSINGDFIWGLSLSISIVIAMVFSPLIGKYSDGTDRKKSLRLYIFLTLIGMFLLTLFPSEFKYIFSIIFIVTNALFVISLSIYDSILPHISSTENRSTVSGFSWGLGYLGGILCLLLVLAFEKYVPEYEKLPFFITMLFYGIFSLISVKALPDIKNKKEEKIKTPINLFNNSYKNILFVLLAVWLINEGIDTVIFFTSLFGRETLMLDKTTLGILLVIVQLVAFPATWFSGILAKRKGHLLIINYSLIIWVLIVLGTQFADNIYHFTLISVFTGLVIGSTQSLLRSYFSLLIPKNKSSYYFGFYTIFSRFATLIGPALFGIIAGVYGQKMGMLSILIPLVIGWFFLNRKKEYE